MLSVRPSRQEIREHELEQFTSLMPPSQQQSLAQRLRKGVGSTTKGVPNECDEDGMDENNPLHTVIVDSEGARLSKKMHRKKLKYRNLFRVTLTLIVLLIVMNKMEDWYFAIMAGNQNDDDVVARIQRDYTEVKSLEDLKTDGVDTWCYATVKKCKCADPLVGHSREDASWWARVHQINVEAASTAAASSDSSLDVLFLGDSITEGWGGTSRGHTIARAAGAKEIFNKYFSKLYHGLALGIAGDTSPNLLWRIQNGELPDKLNPKVIWLLIGTNDFGNTWCSPELVVIGIIRVVEELLIKKPNAKIIVNGLLPRTYSPKGYVMRGYWNMWERKSYPSLWKDIEAVNTELRHYCYAKKNVEYFETKVFFDDPTATQEKLRIPNKLMPDRLHPSAAGYQLWAEQMIEVLDRYLPRL